MASSWHPLRRLCAAAGLVLAAALAGGCLANVTIVPAGANPVALTVLDANADGRSDLAVLDAATHTVQLLEQEDGGSLTRAATLVPDAGAAPSDLVGGIADTGGSPALAVTEPALDRVAFF